MYLPLWAAAGALCSSSFCTVVHPRGWHTALNCGRGSWRIKMKPLHRKHVKGKAQQQAKAEVKAFQISVPVARRLQFGKQHSFLGTTSPKVHCGKNVPRTS